MGNAAATPATSTTIKLLIAKDAQVVLYAEAGKEVIDFLLGLLAMPAAAMIKHTTSKDKGSPLGALAILYDSVERMEPEFMHSPKTRDALLNPSPVHPALAAAAGWFPSLIQPSPPPPPAVKLYECSQGGHNDCYNYVAVVENTPCRKCRGKMNYPKELHLSSGGGHGEALEALGLGQAPAAAAGTGFVQGVATYMVMDDLAVAPMSAVCGVTALRGLGVTDLTSLEVQSVQVGYNEGVEILRASLQSKTVLTDVFLRKNMGKQDEVAPSDKKKRS